MEEKKEELKEKIVVINRKNGKTITNAVDILYYQKILQDQINESMLLGTFSADGKYSISKEIVNELIAIGKVAIETFNGNYTLISKCKNDEKFNLKFSIKVGKLDGLKRGAILAINEKVTLYGQLKENLVTPIAKYVDEDDMFFTKKLKKVFNFVDKSEDSGEKFDETAASLILKRKIDLASTQANLELFDEEISKIYINKVIALLQNKTDKFSLFAMRRYKEILLLLDGEKGNKNYYKKLREQLIEVFESVESSQIDPELKKQLDALKAEYIAANSRQFDLIVSMKKMKEQMKQKEVAKGGKDSAGGAKSGGGKSGGSKPAKKADAKSVSTKKELIDFDELYGYMLRAMQKAAPKQAPKQEPKIEQENKPNQEEEQAIKAAVMIAAAVNNAVDVINNVYTLSQQPQSAVVNVSKLVGAVENVTSEVEMLTNDDKKPLSEVELEK